MWPWPDPRSRWRRSRGFWSSKNCRKLHFSRSISSAISAWSLTVIVDHDSMGPVLQLRRAWFSNFLNKGIMWVQTSRNVDITLISNGHISVLLEATVTWSVYVLYMLMWPWPDPRSRSLTSSIFANCILAWSSKLMVDYDSMGLVHSYSKPNVRISPPVGGYMTSKFVKCWYHRNPLGFVSALAAARSLWLWLQVGRNKLYTLVMMTVSPLVGLFYRHPLALCNRADHYIFALWFLSSIYLSIFFFFPRLISAATAWMSTILLHMAWP